MTNDLLGRAMLFYTYTQQPMFLVIDLLGDKRDHWFVMYDFKESNPSNHTYANELTGKCIDNEMFNPMEMDQVQFLTKLDAIPKVKLKFPPTCRWAQVK